MKLFESPPENSMIPAARHPEAGIKSNPRSSRASVTQENEISAIPDMQEIHFGTLCGSSRPPSAPLRFPPVNSRMKRAGYGS